MLQLVLPLVAIILLQAFLAGLSMSILSTVRAYVTGSNMWSKGQQDAVYSLSLYSDTGLPEYYDRFRAALAVPLGDRDARLVMEHEPTDIAAARKGLLEGRNDPDDIDGLIWMFRWFHNLPLMKPAVIHWANTDPPIEELGDLGEKIRAQIAAGQLSQQQRDDRRAEIDRFNSRIVPLATEFVQSLGEASRKIKSVLIVLNLFTAGILVLLVLLLTRYFFAQHRRFTDELRAEKERAQITLASIGDAVITTDADGCVDYMNYAAERLIGRTCVDVKGVPLTSLLVILDEGNGEARFGVVEHLLKGRELPPNTRPQQLRRHDGTSVPVSMVGTPLHQDDRVVGAVLALHDMTSEKKYIARLSWQASHDSLTKLANRREFEHRLERALQRLEQYSDSAHALMFVDLDQFKIINDTCGHAAGDKLLQEVSASLQQHLRTEDLLARLGGDEFAVLLENRDIEHAAIIAERLRHAVQDMNFVWNERSFTVTASIGLVQMLQGNTTKDETLRSADLACYLAKEKGRNRIQIHNPSDTELLHRFGEMAWVQRIHEALDQQRFCLFAQTIAPLQNAHETGKHIELLLRLRDRDGKLVPPGDFIPAAERYGLMPLIDRWVVRHAFATLASRIGGAAPEAIATCAINLSGATFGDDGFIDYVHDQLREYDIPPTMICFEITETSAIANLENANRFIDVLQAMGCRFALDDFGSGMSSFGYLKHMPVNYLKIDGGFVKDMLDDPIDRAMVEMICRIGKVMGKETIAEFAENDAIIVALRDLGVDYAQGYGVSRPEPFDIVDSGQADTRLCVA